MVNVDVTPVGPNRTMAGSTSSQVNVMQSQVTPMTDPNDSMNLVETNVDTGATAEMVPHSARRDMIGVTLSMDDDMDDPMQSGLSKFEHKRAD